MKHPRSRITPLFLAILLILAFSLTVAIASAKPDKNAEKSIGDLEFLGMVTFETGTEFMGTQLGGLSGITYDASRGVYYALSDDRSEENDARFYTVAIDLTDGWLDDGDVEFLSYTTILNEDGQPFAENTVDPEGIAMRASGQLFISSEAPGDEDPFVKRFNLNGTQTASLPLPDKFLPDEDSGVVENNALESLAVTPDNKMLWTGTEAALKQDGDPSTPDSESPARLLAFHAPRRQPMAEYVYVVEAIPNPPTPVEPAFPPDNGLVELVAVDNAGTLLAMERSYWDGDGNTIRLFEIKTADATDVSGYFDLDDAPSYTPVEKRLLLELSTATTPDPDNVEAATFGPMLPDGRYILILVSDNNFRGSQETQFIAYAVEID